jgi:nucleoside 2-deoxyribosyltransferase
MATSRPFPRRTLENALRVPQAIKDMNGGNPWSPDQVAKALGAGAKGGNFFYLTGAARDYGLTEGSRDTATIAITELGRRAVYPESADQAEEARLAAFLHVASFRRLLDHFKGANLSGREFLENTLQTTFGIDIKFHDEFVEIFKKNCQFLGIGENFVAGDLGSGARSIGGQPQTRTVASPTGADDAPVCFVIMPFTEREDRHESGFFEEVLAQVLTPAAQQAGFQVRTARKMGSDVIQATIVKELMQAQLVLADLTEHNPNVLFELGVRVKEDKPVVLVKAQGTGPIFDVDNMLRVETYNPNLWASTVETDVPRISDHIRATWDNRDTSETLMQILLRHSP